MAIVRASADVLSKPFRDEAFARCAILFADREQKPRWKKRGEATDRALGRAL